MKHAKTILSVAVVLFAMAMPSISAAQYPDQNLNKFLDKHQNIKSYLVRNPNLIYDKQFRHQHPALQEWTQQHPNVWKKLPNYSRWGDYDESNQWHEHDWWHEHHPDWMYAHHPEWAESHPEWKDDGDFDDHHEWRDRQWWNDHHPDWVQKHHPNWYKHEAHAEAKEEQREEKMHEHYGNPNPSENGQEHGHHGNKGKHDHD
jgi:hypothetical protein